MFNFTFFYVLSSPCLNSYKTNLCLRKGYLLDPLNYWIIRVRVNFFLRYGNTSLIIYDLISILGLYCFIIK